MSCSFESVRHYPAILPADELNRPYTRFKDGRPVKKVIFKAATRSRGEPGFAFTPAFPGFS
jgi:hypothetical protein